MTQFKFGGEKRNNSNRLTPVNDINSEVMVNDGVYRGITQTFKDTLTSATGGLVDTSLRQIIGSGSVLESGTMARFLLKGNNIEPTEIDNISIGIRSGTTPDCTDVPVEVLVDGNSGTTLALNQLKWTDWVRFDFNNTNSYLLIFDIGNVSGSDTASTEVTGGDGYYQLAAANTYNLQNMGGSPTLNSTNIILVTEIEVQHWKRAASDTPRPLGVYDGSDVILNGVMTTTGLVADKHYFMSDSVSVDSTSDLVSTDCSSLTGWTDLDTSTGVTSVDTTTFPGLSVFKLSTGATLSSVASVEKDLGVIGSGNWVVKIKVFHSAIGTEPNGDILIFQVHDGGINFNVHFSSEGLLVIKAGGANVNVFPQGVQIGKWQTWIFDVNAVTPSTATCDVYLEGMKVVSKADCDFETTPTPDGLVLFTQQSNTTANRLSYVDLVEVGTSLVNLAGLTTIPTTTVLGKALSSTELLVDINTAKNSASGEKSGYCASGINLKRLINKLNFTNEFTSLVNSTLSAGNKNSGTAFNSKTSGYLGAGDIDAASVGSSSIEKLIFTSQSTQVLTSVFPTTATLLNNDGGESSTHGYTMGGANPTTISHIDKLIFSSENTAAVTSKLPAAITLLKGFNSSIKCYVGGGSGFSAIQVLTFVNDNTATVTSVLSAIVTHPTGIEDLHKAGYIMGGLEPPGRTTKIAKLLFSNESRTDLSSGISEAIDAFYGNNSSLQGYCYGGTNTTGALSKIEKLKFSTELTNVLQSKLHEITSHNFCFEQTQ